MYEAFIALISSMNKKIHDRIQQVKDSIPTKVSQLMNDKKYTTESQLKVTTDVANTALIIAKGANKALSYGDYNTMITSLNTMTKDALNPGQNIMIVTLEVPDLWVHSVSSNSMPYEYTSDQKLLEDMNSNSGILQVGYYILSQLETQKVDLSDYKTKDVQIDGTSIVGEDGVANIGISDSSNPGVVKTTNTRGAYTDSGFLVIFEAKNDNIDQRNNKYRPITSDNLDYAVKAAMCDGKGDAWTAEEQIVARDRMGIGKSIYLNPDAISEDITSISFDLDDKYNEFLIEINAPINDSDTNGAIRINRTDSIYGYILYHGVLTERDQYKKGEVNKIYVRLSVFSDSLLAFSYRTTANKSGTQTNFGSATMTNNINSNYGGEEPWGDDGWNKINIMVYGSIFPSGTIFKIRGWKR